MIDPEQEMAEVRELSAQRKLREGSERSKKHVRLARESHIQQTKKNAAMREKQKSRWVWGSK